MGGGASKASYATLEKTVIGDDKWVTFCETYDLTLQEQSEFFALWSRMDRKRRGEVNAEQFRKTWYLLPSADTTDEQNREIILRWFLSLDKDAVPGAEHRLYFQEFAVIRIFFTYHHFLLIIITIIHHYHLFHPLSLKRSAPSHSARSVSTVS